MNYENKLININMLEINTENPRFEMARNQREAIRIMIENQNSKLAKLAQDIIENGLNPSDLIIVMPSKKHDHKFVVLEGNRRVTALKLLNNNDLIPQKYKSLIRKFRQLSSKYDRNPIEDISCVVFSNIDDANKWIKLKHTGENDGVGLVTWDAQQKARFEERYEGKSTYALQIIDFLKNDPDIDADTKRKLSLIPSSSLQRLLSDPDVRSVIGISIDNGKIVSKYPQNEIRKPLIKIISDLARDDFTVKDIYYKDDRLNYLETFKAKELPDKSLEVQEWEIISKNTLTPLKTKSKKRKPISTERNTIIPKSYTINIGNSRINKIFQELKRLDLRDFTNSSAITFRVFIELSVDHFIEKNKIEISENDKLNKKISKVSDYLKENKLLTKNELKPINTSISNPNSIFSINTFNAYVHNKHFNPIATDLKTTWDNIEPFITKLWELA